MMDEVSEPQVTLETEGVLAKECDVPGSKLEDAIQSQESKNTDKSGLVIKLDGESVVNTNGIDNVESCEEENNVEQGVNNIGNNEEKNDGEVKEIVEPNNVDCKENTVVSEGNESFRPVEETTASEMPVEGEVSSLDSQSSNAKLESQNNHVESNRETPANAEDVNSQRQSPTVTIEQLEEQPCDDEEEEESSRLEEGESKQVNSDTTRSSGEMAGDKGGGEVAEAREQQTDEGKGESQLEEQGEKSKDMCGGDVSEASAAQVPETSANSLEGAEDDSKKAATEEKTAESTNGVAVDERSSTVAETDDEGSAKGEDNEVEAMEVDEAAAEAPCGASEDKADALEEDHDEPMLLPEAAEAETITGDTSKQPPAELTEGIGKDAEVCIIPDDVTPRRHAEGGPVSTIRVSTALHDNQDSAAQAEGPHRPKRTAAKVAGSKIRSLVESDLEADEEVKMTTPSNTAVHHCVRCRKVVGTKFLAVEGDKCMQYLCSNGCYVALMKDSHPRHSSTEQQSEEVDDVDEVGAEPSRKCAHCRQLVTTENNKNLSWETLDFCNEECLEKHQLERGSRCANCKGAVVQASLGKYCVRFGYDVKQFCSSLCLEEYKKGLKVCSYCQKDISSGVEGFLAPVGDKGQFKDFCTQSCMEKYEHMSSNTPPAEVVAECAVCSNKKPVTVEVQLEGKTQKLCSEPCFAAFKFVNNINEGQCGMCKKYFDRMKTGKFCIFYNDTPLSFCCRTCMNVYILANRKIVPCNWCKVKKYNFDMIKKVTMPGQVLMMCSLNCLTLYQVSVNAATTRPLKCHMCMAHAQAQYHLTMSDATIKDFCSYKCVMSFQSQYSKQRASISGTEPIPIGGPRKVIMVSRRQDTATTSIPLISSVHSLGTTAEVSTDTATGSAVNVRLSLPASEAEIEPTEQQDQSPPPVASASPGAPQQSQAQQPMVQVYQQVITKPPKPKEMMNKAVLTKPYSHTKGVSCRPHSCLKETQTDETLNRKCLIPIPVPIFVPAPMHMYSAPFPVAVPFPLPIPVPIFIPTTRNSAKGIFKEIKKIQEKIPTDPFEAELLMMAEMVAGEKKQDPTDSESEEGNEAEDAPETFSPEVVDTSNTFGDDMLQIALKMASELDEPAVDMEAVLTPNTITPSSQPAGDPNKGLYAAADPDDPDAVPVMAMNRGRKRALRGSRSSGGLQNKRGRRSSSSVDVPMMPPPEPVQPPRIEVEKPDANMCLKYTFGVNAWRHWVMQKNSELEKAAMTNRKIKLFKPELLQLTADELNFSLCLFVKEVRKPNNTEYAPDTIYYLCLGIQQYLFENGRIDNIFTDTYYEKFTDCLDEVAKKFAALYNDSQYIVTRVEEEHLWESKQLGAHSPHVLLSTLMFFNTKHFNLVTVEEHMQLSFSHIMKHWKRNPNAPGVAKVPGSRNVLLRFYPPQSALEANSRKKKVYEQQENEENPLRCPVKLYEFYLSKCPESVKTRNDVFYLLPERSCVPDSPVWYSTMALGKEPLMKMLHRVKMVKEINIALLTS